MPPLPCRWPPWARRLVLSCLRCLSCLSCCWAAAPVPVAVRVGAAPRPPPVVYPYTLVRTAQAMSPSSPARIELEARLPGMLEQWQAGVAETERRAAARRRR